MRNKNVLSIFIICLSSLFGKLVKMIFCVSLLISLNMTCFSLLNKNLPTKDLSTHHIATASLPRLIVPPLLGSSADFADPLEGVQRTFLCINIQQILHRSTNLPAYVHALRAIPLQMIAVLVVIVVPLAHFAPDVLQGPGSADGAGAGWHAAPGEASGALGSSSWPFHHHHARRRGWHRHR